MEKLRTALALTLLMLCAGAAAQEACPAAGKAPCLRVAVESPRAGRIFIAVAGEAGFSRMDANAAGQSRDLPGPGEAVFEFMGLAPGTYAVKVFLDEDGNGKLGIGMLGVPKEAWGMSWKGTRPRLRPPRFGDASFSYPETASLRVKLE